jgi:hypothetical protein
MQVTSFKDVGAGLKITNGCKVTVLSEPVSTEAEFNGKKSTQYFVYGDIDGKVGSFRLPVGVIKSARSIAMNESKTVFDLIWKITWQGDGLLRKYTVYPAGDSQVPDASALESNLEKVKAYVTKLEEGKKADKELDEKMEVKPTDIPF